MCVCEWGPKAKILILNKFEPQHAISRNVVCATSKASDQPAHTCLCQSLEHSIHEFEATDWTSFRVSKLKRRLHRLVWVYSCQNGTLLEITCCVSIVYKHPSVASATVRFGAVILLSFLPSCVGLFSILVLILQRSFKFTLLQSSSWGRESSVRRFIAVMWIHVPSSRCQGMVCSLWVWHLLVTYRNTVYLASTATVKSCILNSPGVKRSLCYHSNFIWSS